MYVGILYRVCSFMVKEKKGWERGAVPHRNNSSIFYYIWQLHLDAWGSSEILNKAYIQVLL